MLRDGQAWQDGSLGSLNLAPGESRVATVPFRTAALQNDAEYLLTLSVTLNEATSWAEAGHEVAWEQMVLSTAAPKAVTLPTMPTLTLDDTKNQATVAGQDFIATFDKKVGGLSSLVYQDHELLAAPLLPNIWRAPTDNDEGGGNKSFAQRWRAAGLDRASFVPQQISARLLNDRAVQITLAGTIESSDSAAHIMDYRGVYTVYGSGDIVLRSSYRVDEAMPPLPKVGLTLKVPPTMDQLAWYGRGPHETYADRYTGAQVARYAGSVAEQYTPYVLPQENGNKTAVRWATLTDRAGVGILASGLLGNHLNVSAHRYNLQDFDQATHTYEVEDTDQVTLNLDYAQAGLGGDDSWTPATHAEYLLDSSSYTFGVRIRPVDMNQSSPEALYKEKLPHVNTTDVVLP